jgi:hypothetical protein
MLHAVRDGRGVSADFAARHRAQAELVISP